MIGFLFVIVLIPLVGGFILALPAALKINDLNEFSLTIIRAAFGIILPIATFFLGAFLVPEWKGGCLYGWLDCFHVGKFALIPIVLWAIAAFYAIEIWHTQHRTRPWIVLGFFLGSLVSIVSLVHGIATVGLKQELSWGLLIPLYVTAWYTGRAIQLVRTSNINILTYLWGLLGSAPFWIFSVLLSKKEYLNLPDNPPDCFVVSAALKGHKTVVGPFVIVNQEGKPQRVNRQLLTLWQFEEFWSLSSPKTHCYFRRIYNTWGPRIASFINSPWVADIVYVLLKPVEMIAKSSLWLTRR